MNEPQTIETIPPLVDGERLTRAEFHRRYEAMPEVKRAELIEGVVHMPSPVSFDDHAEPHYWLVGWSLVYTASTPGVRGGDNGTVQLDDENEPQPDVLMLIRPECGGQASIRGHYVVDAPEFVAEVSYSRVSVDLGERYRAYQRNGVREYLVWRLDTNAILWFVLRNGLYQRLLPDTTGVIKSEVFPGLWLDANALTRMDGPTVMCVLQQGLASPEHAAFVQQLAQRRAQP